MDMTKAELVRLITETVNQTVYGDIKDIPDYWEGDIKELLDMGVIDGGTPAKQNDHDVNLSRTEAKMLVIMMRVLKKCGVIK